VDAALRGDRVRPPRRVVVGEDLHPVALLAERGRRRRAGQAGADDDHVELPPVVRRDELHVELVVRPLVGEGTRRDVAVELADHPWASSYSMQLTMTSPSTRQSGLSSALTRPAKRTARLRRHEAQRGLFRPRLWNIDQAPWNRCTPRARLATM